MMMAMTVKITIACDVLVQEIVCARWVASVELARSHAPLPPLVACEKNGLLHKWRLLAACPTSQETHDSWLAHVAVEIQVPVLEASGVLGAIVRFRLCGCRTW